MKLGIKIGLRSDWKNDLLQSRPDFCEIWFDARKIEDYSEIFAFLFREKIPSGIHFWGALPDHTLANIAYPDADTMEQSCQLVEATIDVAQKHHCLYVNIHPGASRLSKVEFNRKSIFTPYTPPVSDAEVTKGLLYSLKRLNDFAQKRNVLLTVESVPKLGTNGTLEDIRGIPVDLGEPEMRILIPILETHDISFANDFGHVVANLVNEKRPQMIEYLQTVSRQLKNRTRLLHVGYVIPPYNGTDYHGSLFFPEFETSDAIPNKSEIIELLKLYRDRNDVYALVEPESNHIDNHKSLQKLVAESSTK